MTSPTSTTYCRHHPPLQPSVPTSCRKESNPREGSSLRRTLGGGRQIYKTPFETCRWHPTPHLRGTHNRYHSDRVMSEQQTVHRSHQPLSRWVNSPHTRPFSNWQGSQIISRNSNHHSTLLAQTMEHVSVNGPPFLATLIS